MGKAFDSLMKDLAETRHRIADAAETESELSAVCDRLRYRLSMLRMIEIDLDCRAKKEWSRMTLTKKGARDGKRL